MDSGVLTLISTNKTILYEHIAKTTSFYDNLFLPNFNSRNIFYIAGQE